MSGHVWRDHELPRNWKRTLILFETVGALFLTGYTTVVAFPLPVLPINAEKSLNIKVVDFALGIDFWVLGLIGLITLLSLGVVRFFDYRWNPQRPYVVSVLRTLEPDMWAKDQSELSCGAHQNRITLFQCVKRSWFHKLINFRQPKTSHLLVPRIRIPVNAGRCRASDYSSQNHLK